MSRLTEVEDRDSFAAYHVARPVYPARLVKVDDVAIVVKGAAMLWTADPSGNFSTGQKVTREQAAVWLRAHRARLRGRRYETRRSAITRQFQAVMYGDLEVYKVVRA